MDSFEHVSIGYFSNGNCLLLYPMLGIGKFHSQTFFTIIELGLNSSFNFLLNTFRCFHLKVDLEDVYLELLELEKFIHNHLSSN